ncbi:MAG: hypothetical protein SOW59_01085 [Corynebacterium sp.]|nr:hypothetical protein [Corynebacterium sp.]
MKSLKSAAHKGAVISVAAMSALVLASCSAGQITQTSNQVAPIDGSGAENEDRTVAVNSALIQVEPATGETSLRFVATNQGYKDEAYTLESITVDGQEVSLNGTVKPMSRNTSIYGDSASILAKTPHDKTTGDTQYVATSLHNDDFGFGGTREVVFNFSNGPIAVDAGISAPQMTSGENFRDVTDTTGYNTKEPNTGGAH